jgi:hypothetical protein
MGCPEGGVVASLSRGTRQGGAVQQRSVLRPEPRQGPAALGTLGLAPPGLYPRFTPQNTGKPSSIPDRLSRQAVG